MKIRVAATAGDPARGLCAICTKKRRPYWGVLLQGNCVGFTDGDLYRFGFSLAVKSIVADKSTDAQFLPCLAVSVLKSQGVILGKREEPVILKSAILWHGKLTGFLIIAGMLGGSAV